MTAMGCANQLYRAKSLTDTQLLQGVGAIALTELYAQVAQPTPHALIPAVRIHAPHTPILRA